jgi:hypothetical protein
VGISVSGEVFGDGAMPEAVKPRLTAQANSPTLVGSVGVCESRVEQRGERVTVSKGARADDRVPRVGVDVRDRTVDPVDSNEPHFGCRGSGDLLRQLC